MTDKAISPLRWRLIEDMTIRRLGPGTQHQYVRHVKSFADFVGRPPDKATHPKPLLRSVADPLLQGRVIVSLSLMCGAAPVRAALRPCATLLRSKRNRGRLALLAALHPVAELLALM